MFGLSARGLRGDIVETTTYVVIDGRTSVRSFPMKERTVGGRLRAQRAALGLSQDQLAQKSGVPLDSYKKYETDQRMPGGEALAALGKAGIDIVDLLLGPDRAEPGGADYNLTVGPAVRGRVPLISWVQAGAFAAVVDNFQPGQAEEWVDTTVPVRRHTYALRVNGDSMTNPSGDPSFPHGSVVVVEPDVVSDLAHMVGSFVIVKRTADDEATFKQLVRDAGSYFLKPLNPRYPMIPVREDDVFCGVVRERVMRFF